MTAKTLSIVNLRSDQSAELSLEGKVLKTKLAGEGQTRICEVA